MIFCTARPVFQSKTVFDRKDDPAVRFEMSGNDLQEIYIRSTALNISLSIFKYTDQRDVIILFGKIFLNILKVAHKNLKIIKVLMSVGIDQASLA